MKITKSKRSVHEENKTLRVNDTEQNRKRTDLLNDYGVLMLFNAMIDLAISDIKGSIPKYREEAIFFLKSEYLLDICETLHLDIRYYIKKKAGRDIYSKVFFTQIEEKKIEMAI
ncbi:hypothetical protein V7D15_07020 [Thermoanaerobacter thermohydrosulfuricus]